MNSKKLLILILYFFQFCVYSQTEEPFYQQISRAVIRLEDSLSGNPVGTAFFVNFRSDSSHYYLVTARHIVESNRTLKARVPSQRLDNKQTEVIELRLPKNIWTFHSIGLHQQEIKNKKEEIAPVDVAVTKLPGILERRIRTIGFDKVDENKNQISKVRAEPPTQILVWGFPGDLGFELEEQHPLGRLGIVAMSASEPFIRTEYKKNVNLLRDDQVLLIDAPILPGNSGSPVFKFSPLSNKILLIGLISASNVSNSFAVVEPSTRIIETIELSLSTNQKVMGGWYLIK